MGQRQKGRVVSIAEDGTASVQVRRRGACSEGGCAHGQLFGPTNNQLTVTARNSLGARVGDWVEIEYDGSLVLKAAFGIYVLPIVLGLVAYVVGNSVLPASQAWMSSIIAGLLIAAAFWTTLRYFSKRSFGYCVVAYSDDEILPVAPACQGCKFLSEDLLKLEE